MIVLGPGARKVELLLLAVKEVLAAAKLQQDAIEELERRSAARCLEIERRLATLERKHAGA